MRCRLLLAALLLISAGSRAQETEAADPKEAEAEAKSAEALGRAKPLALEGKTLSLDGRTLALDGKVLEIRGAARGIEGAPKEIQASLKELKAQVSETEVRIELSGDVLFDFDKATLRKDALVNLVQLGQVIKGYPKGPITIEGFTDAKGKDDYNQKLSERRAASVKDWLVKNAGVPAARVSTKGWGRQKPVAPNAKPDGSDDPDGRQKNRRVEIVIKTG